MAAVVAFVALMTCIVLWITSSLITHELDQPIPTSIVPTVMPLQPTSTPTAVPETPTAVDPTITPDPGPARYVRFVTFDLRPSKITVGQCIRLRWEVEFAVSLQLYRNNELLLEDAPPAHTFQDCPKQTGYMVYRLEATNRKGQTNWIQGQVKVVEAP
jgi:hypothetical protein